MGDMKRRPDQSEAKLQDALGEVDWDMFQSSSSDISEVFDRGSEERSTEISGVAK